MPILDILPRNLKILFTGGFLESETYQPQHQNMGKYWTTMHLLEYDSQKISGPKMVPLVFSQSCHQLRGFPCFQLTGLDCEVAFDTWRETRHWTS